MTIKVITPDAPVFEGEVNQVKFPGSKGGFEVLKDHAPLISTLGKGTLELDTLSEGTKRYQIDGGVVEVLHNNISVLVETVISAG
ncbi:MAG: ATP synthase F1 subunit epsilon [Microscillaceae bacterium]|jgi:F-type H+-transporting ATPase subunit epsilon|nr:ATP synthase F1 subunit epsilon [Microscillaceae bacterium]